MSLQQKFFASLPLLSASESGAQDVLRYRGQIYDEEDGRMKVESHYLDYKHTFDFGTTVGLRYAIDTLSGQTPTGTHANLDDTDWLFQQISDERTVQVITLEHEIDDYSLSFEYAHSEETDYLSNAIAMSLGREFFDKNTTISAGFSYAFDQVVSTPFTTITRDQDKDSFDLSLGVSQLLGPNTVLDFNLGYGNSSGYLSDPYRRISQTKTILVETPVGSFPVTDTFDYAENRPDSIDRWVAKVSAKHYFEPIKGALHGSYRFFNNSTSITGHTFEIKWIQEITDQLSFSPYFRYYRQSGADFYYSALTDTGIDGHGRIDGQGPHYSSDYRLAAMDAITYGLQFSYSPIEDLTIDLQLERYEMSGRDSATPDIFFPTANVVSVGLQWRF
ncbi:DUF3570 domain-containing protein [bacterium]|nr:DUF3570 domain-containing protein [Akkermansiaceae bacterium]MDB4422675.1 DUF3570 domain-containing protein [bacterium]